MRRLVLLLMGAALVLAMAGSAPAGLLLPEDGGEGFWGDPNALEGSSWGFPIEYGPGYYNALTLIQALVIPLETPEQFLEDTHLDPGGHYPLVKGGGNPTPVGWTNVANYGDVWLLQGGNALQGGFQYFTAWFGLGTVSHYVVSGSPDFVLQLQAYGYDVRDPSHTIFRLHNQEFWFQDDHWEHYYYGGKAYASESGLSGAGVTAWGATSPVPEPASMAIWGSLAALGLAGAWWRRRRKAL